MHKCKPTDIDGVFAGRFRQIYGRPRHAYAHTGHWHSDFLTSTNLMKVEQHETLTAPDAHDAVRRLRDTPIWKLESALKCRSCRTPRYLPPVHMIRLTKEQKIVPYVWFIGTTTGEENRSPPTNCVTRQRRACHRRYECRERRQDLLKSINGVRSFRHS
jgi:hypothetical protein